MSGDIKLKYQAATTAMTVTNLHSLASSQSWIAGWSSASVDNKTSNLDLDYVVSATFTTNSSNRQAGTVNVYIMGALNDTPTWFTTASGTPGTEGALSFTAIEQIQSWCRLLASFSVNSTASQVYAIPPTGIAQLFGGVCPTQWAIFVTGNATTTTTAQFAASGSAFYYTPILAQYT
jgi:hypothetical protein